MRFISAVVTAFVFFLSGCASTSQGVSSDYRLDTQGDKGAVVLAVRLDDRCGTRMSTFKLDYRKTGTGEYVGGYFLLNNMLIRNDFKDPAGFFYVRELPAGQYKFTSISDGASLWSHSILQPTIKFDVAAGKAQYLGEVAVTFECKNPGAITPTITINDERKRDGELFDARMKNITSKVLIYSIMHR